MAMACHVKYPLFLLFSCAGTLLIAYSVRAELSPGSGKKPLSYNPQPYNFPSEQLYQAYLVIQRFKNTITCDPKKITSTWAGHDICGKASYLGFSCSSPSVASKNLTVTSINFHGFGLCAPKLQGFIDQLPHLAIFQATSNRFSGDIPRLADNPADQTYQPLGRLCTDADIYLILKFHAKIFCDYGYGIQKEDELVSRPGWTNGKVLILNNNRLSGVIPADIGFSALSFVALANNKLTGQIPPSISHLQDSLLELVLLNNQLSGCLPHELGMLHKAAVIDAGMNQLTGPIPASFSCLSSVEQLNLAGNRLYGEVPDALCKLAAGPTGRLANLTLSGNYFTSVGPACAALIKDGVLDVHNNCIPGLANQRRPADCAAFQRQPKTTCPAAASAQVICPTTAAKDSASAAPGERKGRDYSSYVTYATLHE